MSENNLSKFRLRRSKKGVKPYGRPKTALRRVTDVITGLLPRPAWLLNLFQSSTAKEDDSATSEGVGRDKEPVPSASSTGEQLVTDTLKKSFILQRPQRMFKENGNANTVSACVVAHPTTRRLTAIMRQSPVSTVNGDEDSHSESTSDYSSLLPHPEYRRKRSFQNINHENVVSDGVEQAAKRELIPQPFAPSSKRQRSSVQFWKALEDTSTPVRDAKRMPIPVASMVRKSLHEDGASFAGFGLSRRRPHLGHPVAQLPLRVGTGVFTRTRPSQTVKSAQSSVAVRTSTPIQVGCNMRARVGATSHALLRTVPDTQEVVPPELSDAKLPLSELSSFSFLPDKSITASVAEGLPAQTASAQIKSAAVVSVAPVVVSAAPAVVSAAPVTVAAVQSPYKFTTPLVTVSPATTSTLTVTDVSRATKAVDISLATDAPHVMAPVRVKQLEQKPEPVIDFGDQFKPVCRVSNSEDVMMNAASEASKSGTAPVDSTNAPVVVAKAPNFNGFGGNFKVSTGQWQCQLCMVRSANSDNRCKSCQTPRPGAKVAAPPEITSFKFGVNTYNAKDAPKQTAAKTSASAELSTATGPTPVKTIEPGSEPVETFSTIKVVEHSQLKTTTADLSVAPASSTPFPSVAGGFKFVQTPAASKDQVKSFEPVKEFQGIDVDPDVNSTFNSHATNPFPTVNFTDTTSSTAAAVIPASSGMFVFGQSTTTFPAFSFRRSAFGAANEPARAASGGPFSMGNPFDANKSSSVEPRRKLKGVRRR